MWFIKKVKSFEQDDYAPAFLACLIFALILYSRTFGSSWSFDDIYVIVTNPDILSLKNFINNANPGRPLRELSSLLDYKLFGSNPSGWHFQNIFWHALNAWMVYVVTLLLVEKKRVGWFAALLFLVHPLQVEVVAQISHRKDSLALFFMLAAFACYLLFIKKRRPVFLVIVFLSTVLAVLAKENAIVFPLFLLVAELVRYPKSIVKQPIFGLVLSIFAGFSIFSVITRLRVDDYLLRANALLVRNNYFEGFDWATYGLTVLKSWGFLFSKLVFPVNLSVNYIVSVPKTSFDLQIITTFLLVILYLIVLILGYRKNYFLFVCLLWMGLLYLPTANLIPINHFAADRYMYAPSVGFFMVTAFIFDKMMKSKSAVVFMVTLITIFSVLTYRQSGVWTHNLALWAQSLRVNPNSAIAISNLGGLQYPDDLQRNLAMQLQAIEINPHQHIIYAKTGHIYEELGDTEKARDFYLQAYRLYDARIDGMYKDLNKYVEERLKQEGLEEK